MHINAVFAGIAVTDIDAAVSGTSHSWPAPSPTSGLCEPLEITHGDTVRFTQVADPIATRSRSSSRRPSSDDRRDRRPPAVSRVPGLFAVGFAGWLLAIVCLVGLAVHGRHLEPEGKLLDAATFCFGSASTC